MCHAPSISENTRRLVVLSSTTSTEIPARDNAGASFGAVSSTLLSACSKLAVK